MNYDSETQRKVGTSETLAKASRGMPGLWPSAMACLLSAVGCFFLLRLADAPSQQDVGIGGSSEIAQVEEQDIPDALSTMSGSAALRTAYNNRKNDCARPLAWVSVRRAPGQAAGTIRLRSGNYFSPVFALSDAPVRIAIPYPAPFETGRGTLEVMESGANAIIALEPPWHSASSAADAVRIVTWATLDRCKRPNG